MSTFPSRYVRGNHDVGNAEGNRHVWYRTYRGGRPKTAIALVNPKKKEEKTKKKERRRTWSSTLMSDQPTGEKNNS